MDENINITEQQAYTGYFDKEIYSQFKKIAKENNRNLSTNPFLSGASRL